MKKFMKVCAIVAVIFVIAGAGLAFVAGSKVGSELVEKTVDQVSGGKFHLKLDWKDWGISVGDFFKNNVVVKQERFYSIDENEQGVIFRKEYEVISGDIALYPIEDEGSALKLQIAGCSLVIEESEDEQIWLEAKNMEGLQCFTEGETLTLLASRTNIGGLITTSEIKLYLPKGYVFEKGVEMELGAGEIRGKGLAADEIRIAVGAGDVNLKDISVEHLACEVGAGNIDCSGNIRQSAILQCALGNITLKPEGRETDFDYEIDCAMGNIDLNGTEYAGFAKSKSIKNGAEKHIEASCSMGNIDINF